MKNHWLWPLLLVMSSCGNSFETKEALDLGGSGTRTVHGDTSNAIGFAEIKAQILEPHCLSCHGAWSTYEAYNPVKEAAMGAISSGRMPKNSAPLSNELKTLMRTWLANGAPNVPAQDPDGSSGASDTDGGNTPDPVDDILEPKWASIQKHIIAPKCLQCHGPGTFLPLATRQDFFDQRDELLNDFQDVEESELVKRLQSNSNPMPPTWSGMEKLTTEEINIVIQWVEQGLPN